MAHGFGIGDEPLVAVLEFNCPLEGTMLPYHLVGDAWVAIVEACTTSQMDTIQNREFTSSQVVRGAISNMESPPVPSDHLQVAFKVGEDTLSTLRSMLRRVHVLGSDELFDQFGRCVDGVGEGAA